MITKEQSTELQCLVSILGMKRVRRCIVANGFNITSNETVEGTEASYHAAKKAYLAFLESLTEK